METRSYAFWTGLFVIGVAAMIGATILWIGHRDRLPMVPYIVETQDSVLGLAPESQVLYRGVVVGKVDDIEFDPRSFENILIHLSVQRRVPVGEKTFATLRLRGITGTLDLELNDDGDAGKRLETSHDDPARIKVRPSLLDRLGTTGKELMADVKGVIDKVDQIVSDENLADLNAFMSNMRQASERLLELETQISNAISGVPGLVGETQATVAHLDRAIGDAQSTLQNIDRTLGEFDRAAAAVVELGGTAEDVAALMTSDTLPGINTLLEELTRTTESLRQITILIRNNPQSLITGSPKPPPGPGEEGYRRPQP